jgi:hypothetical protein
MFSGYRQAEAEGGTHAFLTLHRDAPVLRLDEVFADSQAWASTAVPLAQRAAHLIEFPEQMEQLVGRYARAGNAHTNNNITIRSPSSKVIDTLSTDVVPKPGGCLPIPARTSPTAAAQAIG